MPRGGRERAARPLPQPSHIPDVASVAAGFKPPAAAAMAANAGAGARHRR